VRTLAEDLEPVAGPRLPACGFDLLVDLADSDLVLDEASFSDVDG